MFFPRIVTQVVGKTREPFKRHVVVGVDTELDSTFAAGLAIPSVLPTSGNIFSGNLSEMVRFLYNQAAIEASAQAGQIKGVDAAAAHLDGRRCEDVLLSPGIEESGYGDDEKKSTYRG